MKKKTKFDDETNRLFIEDKGIWGRFIKMLFKGHLPIIWIAVYIACDIFLVNLGLSVTEVTANLMAGDLSWKTILIYIGYGIINLCMSSITTLVNYFVQARIDRNLRRMVWDKTTRLPMTYFDRYKPRELLTRITSDTSTISTLIMQVIIPFFTGFYTVVVVFIKVFSYDPMLMMSLLIVIPFVFMTAFVMGKLKFGINDEVNSSYAELSRNVSEKITNNQLVKSTAKEEKEVEEGVFRFRDYYRAAVKSSWITNLTSPVYVLVNVLQIIVIVLVGRQFYQSGKITLSEWIAYFAFAQQLSTALQAYAGYWASIKSSQGACRRVTYVMDEKNESLGTDKSAEDMSGSFTFHDVSFSYGEHLVLDHVNLTIPEGSTTAFIGMSGGGKTTMLNLLERFYTPAENGSITVGDVDINSYNMKSYREQIAYITQESFMLSGSIKDNILYGVKREVTDEEIMDACKKANAYDFIMEMPNGMNENVGEGGGRLSGGQKQRISIARAILKNPKFMFLDEATAAMDVKAKDEVWKGLESLMNGRTTVMVAHDYQTASHANYIVVLDHGHIIDAGGPEELYLRNEFFRNFVKLSKEAA